jgi:hypothetical protein
MIFIKNEGLIRGFDVGKISGNADFLEKQYIPKALLDLYLSLNLH